MKINDIIISPNPALGVLNSIVKPAVEGSNYYNLSVKVKDKLNPTITFTENRIVYYQVKATVIIQDFVLTGNDNTFYPKISSNALLGRTITFKVINPQNYPLSIKVKLFDYFNHETRELNTIQSQPGSYSITTEVDLMQTKYNLTLEVTSSDGAVNFIESKTYCKLGTTSVVNCDTSLSFVIVLGKNGPLLSIIS